ncbi:MAG: hypothetical protein ETSY1_27315, partial [Candidatus Entotheonella factor]
RQLELSYLEKANLFVVALDDEGYWYRYHHLFQALLRRKLQAHLGRDEIANLQRRASTWFYTEGLIEDAMRYALESGDELEAANVVERQRYQLIDQQDYHTLIHWMAQLPDTLVQQRPALLLTQAWIAHLQYRSEAMTPLILQAEVALEHNPQFLDIADLHILQGEVHLLWAVVYYWWGEGEKMLSHAQRALEHIPPTLTFFYSTSQMGVAWGYQMTGQTAKAIAFLQTTFELDPRSKPPVVHARLLHAMGLVSFRSGDLMACREPFLRLIEIAEPNQFILDLGWAHCCLGRVCYEWNWLTEALEHFSTAARCLQSTSLLTLLQANVFNLALTYQALGQPDEAQATLDQLCNMISNWETKAMLDETKAFEARLFLLQGRPAVAARQLETINLNIPEQLGDRTQLLPLIQVRCLLAQGGQTHLHTALDILHAVGLVVRNANHHPFMIETLALDALVQAALGQEEAALNVLHEAVILAKPGGFIRTWVDMGPSMARLLGQLVAHGTETDYLRRVLAAFDRVPSSPSLFP